MPEHPRIEELLVDENATLREALSVIDPHGLGICFVTREGDGVMSGVLSDGDIRRYLLEGNELDDKVASACQRDFLAMPLGTSNDELLKKFSDKYQIIPLLDDEGVPVDYATPSKLRHIPVYEPYIGEEELANVHDCVSKGWISSKGDYVNRFEKEFGERHEGLHALSVSNGTVAIQLALKALGIGEGDEVIIPDLTFAASANAVIHAGAKPVLVDVERSTWTMDPQEVEEAISPRTKAILPVHLYGHPCRMDELIRIAEDNDLWVVEDCAESLGSELNGRLTGTFGHAAAFSFFGNKTLTTGEGGMVLFKDEECYEAAKILRDHGMKPGERYWHEVVGFNFRMTNMQAAVGVAQLEKLDRTLDKKRGIARQYAELFNDIEAIEGAPEEEGVKNSYWLYTILYDEQQGGVKKEVLAEKLLRNGIETRYVFHPLHRMEIYREGVPEGRTAFPVSEEIHAKGICLPSSPSLGEEEMSWVASVMKNVFEVERINPER